VHELPRGGVMPCQERDFWEMGPGACEGGGREILNAVPLCVNALAPSPMANGKENRESSAITLAGLSSRRTLRWPRSAARVPPPSSPVDGPPHKCDPRLPRSLGRSLFGSSLGTNIPVQDCGRMTSTDEKRVTQLVVALPGPHSETERATPGSVPRRSPRAVKAATRRSGDGLRPAWTAECCAEVSAHPIFLSEKWGFFRVSLERDALAMILLFALGN
jgi:hypothetical protein